MTAALAASTGGGATPGSCDRPRRLLEEHVAAPCGECAECLSLSCQTGGQRALLLLPFPPNWFPQSQWDQPQNWSTPPTPTPSPPTQLCHTPGPEANPAFSVYNQSCRAKQSESAGRTAGAGARPPFSGTGGPARPWKSLDYSPHNERPGSAGSAPPPPRSHTRRQQHYC